ncbi:transcriptional regulator [Synechococcus sp. WH 8020]|uniref:Crp/Fnr family transcriptional regulator n=1 Tax=Synechococcus sp. (strain WH8020) TaxID=32052 RepID=UPI000652862F|nr:Crp/Fnr family transcriptional regulator [Synechococcus sp. WH 8020]AKN60561.1 transcriptional regulator [Synechococcus sp. WH 8020]
MVCTPSNSSEFLGDLENSYQRRLIHFDSGAKVPLLSDHLWIVVRGIVKLSCLNEQGEDILIGLAGANEPFGEPLTHLNLYEATTLDHCDLLGLSMQDVKTNPDLSNSLMKAMMRRTRQSESLIALLGLRGVENRVKSFLELLAEDYGHPCEQGLKLNLRLTHQEIAGAVSTTRVTVTKVLGQLKESGWLQHDNNQRIIVSYLPNPVKYKNIPTQKTSSSR